MDLNALEDFQLVAAARRLWPSCRASGWSKGRPLWRRVADLEEALGIRLIERGDRSLELAEAGQLLLARIGDPCAKLPKRSQRRGMISWSRGRLRIAAPLLFSASGIGTACRPRSRPSIPRFRSKSCPRIGSPTSSTSISTSPSASTRRRTTSWSCRCFRQGPAGPRGCPLCADAEGTQRQGVSRARRRNAELSRW